MGMLSPPFTCQVPFDWEGVDANIAEVRIEIERGISPRSGRPAQQLRRAHLSLRGLIIGAQRISTLQIGVQRKSNHPLVRRLFGENELLARREADDARHAELQLGKIVARYDELLLARL